MQFLIFRINDLKCSFRVFKCSQTHRGQRLLLVFCTDCS